MAPQQCGLEECYGYRQVCAREDTGRTYPKDFLLRRATISLRYGILSQVRCPSSWFRSRLWPDLTNKILRNGGGGGEWFIRERFWRRNCLVLHSAALNMVLWWPELLQPPCDHKMNYPTVSECVITRRGKLSLWDPHSLGKSRESVREKWRCWSHQLGRSPMAGIKIIETISGIWRPWWDPEHEHACGGDISETLKLSASKDQV